MKLTIHIGIRKTGTTSIQASLRKNKGILLKQGVYVLDYDSLNQYEFALAADVSQNLKFYINKLKNEISYEFHKYSTEYYKKFEEELSYLPDSINNLVISSEDCSLLDFASVNYLKEKLDPMFDCIEVISYFRRQDRYVTSNVTTALRSGYSVNLNDIFKGNINHLKYFEMISCWSEAFGKENIKCRIFEREKLENNDLIYDFYNALNIKNIHSFDLSSISENESFDFVTARCINIYNSNADFFPINHNDRDELVKKIKKKSEIKFLPGKEKAIAFQDIFKENNQLLHKSFFKDYKELFNNSFNEYPEKVPLQKEIDEQLIKNLTLDIISLNIELEENLSQKVKLNQNIEFLKNLGIKYERLGDLSTALKIFEICKLIRPNGQFILEKIKELSVEKSDC